MIFINPDAVRPPHDWVQNALRLTRELLRKSPDEREAFITRHRDATWGDRELLRALRAVAGNKCWYSEVRLEGADPNIDHFRPKGRVREVDEDFHNAGQTSAGYWWLAFEVQNFRLTAMHANQRRVDESTSGGKWDYFPVRGDRCSELTVWGCIAEDNLALDPCKASDVRLLWFDPDGNPCPSPWCTSESDKHRVKATIWLYHLDKNELQQRRAKHVEEIRIELRKADAYHKLWNPNGPRPDLQAKNTFDMKVAEIRAKLVDEAEFAGAKRSAVRMSLPDYPWIDEFIL